MRRALLPFLMAGALAGDLAAQESSDRSWWVGLGLGLGSAFVDDVWGLWTPSTPRAGLLVMPMLGDLPR